MFGMLIKHDMWEFLYWDKVDCKPDKTKLSMMKCQRFIVQFYTITSCVIESSYWVNLEYNVDATDYLSDVIVYNCISDVSIIICKI